MTQLCTKPRASQAILFILICVSVLVVFEVRIAIAQTPLFISPQRVELGDRSRSEVLTVTNRTDNRAAYELGLEDYSMSEDGATMRVESLDYSARRIIRFSPRRFTLEPGQTQTIRVLSRRSGQLADGTYRTHLVFREVTPSSDADGPREPTPGGTSFGIGFRFNIAIPVVIAAGESQSSVGVEEAEILPEGVRVKLKRDGNADAAVRVRVRWERPDGKVEDVIPESVVRIYRERDWVQKTLIASWPTGDVPTEGNLIITLLPEARNKTDVLDELVTPLS